jgi:hypothetical protein
MALRQVIIEFLYQHTKGVSRNTLFRHLKKHDPYIKGLPGSATLARIRHTLRAMAKSGELVGTGSIMTGVVEPPADAYERYQIGVNAWLKITRKKLS